MMRKFHVIQGGNEPPTVAGNVRKRTRASARDWPHCPHCGGRETIAAKIGNVTSKLCVGCLTQGKRVVVS